MTHEADSSLVLVELQVALFRECNNQRPPDPNDTDGQVHWSKKGKGNKCSFEIYRADAVCIGFATQRSNLSHKLTLKEPSKLQQTTLLFLVFFFE